MTYIFILEAENRVSDVDKDQPLKSMSGVAFYLITYEKKTNK